MKQRQNQNLVIVKILGTIAVLALLGTIGLLVFGRTNEAGITGLVGVASSAAGSLGGVLKGSKGEE